MITVYVLVRGVCARSPFGASLPAIVFRLDIPGCQSISSFRPLVCHGALLYRRVWDFDSAFTVSQLVSAMFLQVFPGRFVRTDISIGGFNTYALLFLFTNFLRTFYEYSLRFEPAAIVPR